MGKSIIDTLEVKDSYEQCVQYDSIKAAIQAHAETYSFNIESELFNQLTKEQQKLWRKEIEQACISGGEMGVELAKDPRYEENSKVKDADLQEELVSEEWIEELRTKLNSMSKEDFKKVFDKYAIEKEMDDWHLQEKEDIYDAVKGWGLYNFECLMKDGTIQRFNGYFDEDCEGHINVHIDGVNDDYDDVDDIVKWRELT